MIRLSASGQQIPVTANMFRSQREPASRLGLVVLVVLRPLEECRGAGVSGGEDVVDV
jgi:hypothetical protein